jgi:hypothetical protein
MPRDEVRVRKRGGGVLFPPIPHLFRGVVFFVYNIGGENAIGELFRADSSTV